MSDFEPKILIFACNWCSYAGADMAGVSRYQMPPNCRVIRVMCSARVRPEQVVSALTHYTDGNYLTRRRGIMLKNLLETMGFEKSRFQVNWVSAAEGARFAKVVSEFVEEIKALGPRTEGSHAG